MAALEKGNKFPSFREFWNVFSKYQEEHNVLFVKSGSKMLLDDHPAKNHMQYDWLRFVCKQSKQTKNPQSNGSRPNQRSWKAHCPAVTKKVDTEYWLMITKAHLVHENHPTDPLTTSLYPENRRIESDEVTKLMASTQIPKSELRNITSSRQGKNVLPKVVWNFSRKFQTDVVRGVSDAEAVEQILKEVEGSGGVCKYGANEGGQFMLLTFMSKEIISLFRKYPDIVIVDATYKVNGYLYPLLNVMCIDANGNGVPVLHAFVRCESVELLSECLQVLSDVCETVPKGFFH